MAARKTKPEGRPKGALGKRNITIKGRLDEIIPDDHLISLLWKMALEGDGQVAKYLADRKWGRVPQPISGDSRGDPIRFTLVDESSDGD